VARQPVAAVGVAVDAVAGAARSAVAATVATLMSRTRQRAAMGITSSSFSSEGPTSAAGREEVAEPQVDSRTHPIGAASLL
jgi:hypothetical protein